MEKINNPEEVCFSKLGMDLVTVILFGKVLEPKWNKQGPEMYDDATLTLEDIKQQFPYPGLMVIAETPLSGAIYRWGNHTDGEWWEVGTMAGYA